MAKFRYIITDLYNGSLRGTDSADVATELSACEDYFVLDTQGANGPEWIVNGRVEEITEIGG